MSAVLASRLRRKCRDIGTVGRRKRYFSFTFEKAGLSAKRSSFFSNPFCLLETDFFFERFPVNFFLSFCKKISNLLTLPTIYAKINPNIIKAHHEKSTDTGDSKPFAEGKRYGERV